MAFKVLLEEIRACTVCAPYLPLGPRPVVQADPAARILLVGQAPGRRVHATGLPFNDPSGDRLRNWLGVTREEFYDPTRFAILPMGFCYPGTGRGGDLPPRPECAPLWRANLLAGLPNIGLTLLMGQYALAWHLHGRQGKTLTETVRNWQTYWEEGIVPLPHPSPRNIRWFKTNPWFEAEVIPAVRQRVNLLLGKA